MQNTPETCSSPRAPSLLISWAGRLMHGSEVETDYVSTEGLQKAMQYLKTQLDSAEAIVKLNYEEIWEMSGPDLDVGFAICENIQAIVDAEVKSVDLRRKLEACKKALERRQDQSQDPLACK